MLKYNNKKPALLQVGLAAEPRKVENGTRKKNKSPVSSLKIQPKNCQERKT